MSRMNWVEKDSRAIVSPCFWVGDYEGERGLVIKTDN